MISVIIPAYNDEGLIKSTISHLKENAYKGLLKEIIVVDAGSTDGTVHHASECGAVVIRSLRRERGALMNLGAEQASGKILYFLLPGTLPPLHFTNEIVRATMKGFSFGSFTVTRDYRHWILKMITWFNESEIDHTRLEYQSLFVMKELFDKCGRFRDDMMLMEDREIISRLKRYSAFVMLRDKIVPPAKKYLVHGIFRTEFSFMIASLMYGMGYPQKKLLKVYQALLGRAPVSAQRTETFSASLSS
jgi:glycosyltransferase involved in cell wall biosynthesis